MLLSASTPEKPMYFIKSKIPGEPGDLFLDLGQYDNGRPAIVLRDAKTMEPVVKATVNIVDTSMTSEEAALRTDCVETLVAADIVKANPSRVVALGSVDYPIHELSDGGKILFELTKFAARLLPENA
jgi:hypothetical protein